MPLQPNLQLSDREAELRLTELSHAHAERMHERRLAYLERIYACRTVDRPPVPVADADPSPDAGNGGSALGEAEQT